MNDGIRLNHDTVAAPQTSLPSSGKCMKLKLCICFSCRLALMFFLWLSFRFDSNVPYCDNARMNGTCKEVKSCARSYTGTYVSFCLVTMPWNFVCDAAMGKIHNAQCASYIFLFRCFDGVLWDIFNIILWGHIPCIYFNDINQSVCCYFYGLCSLSCAVCPLEDL